MNDNHLTLFCLVDGEATSNAFPVEIESTKTIGDLKGLIKTKKTNDFQDVDADKLTLWRVSIHDDDDNDLPVLLDSVPVKKKLRVTNKLSMVFDADLPEDTIHVIVQRPLPVAKRDREEDAGPSSSRKRPSSLSRTALELHGANIKDMDKISAPRGILLPVVGTSDLYVREAYKDLYDIIVDKFENNRPCTGNEVEKHIIVTARNATFLEGALLFDPAISRLLKPFLSLPDTWYFVDSSPDPILGRAKTVISASPKTLFSEARQFKDVEKEVTWRYYMAPWHLEELQKCWASGYKLRGGSFGSGRRALLKIAVCRDMCLKLSPDDLDSAKVTACERLEQALKTVKDPVTLMQYFSQAKESLDFMLERLISEPNGSASGIMFEAYVLRAFREGGHTFEIRDLLTGDLASLDIPWNPEVTHFDKITPVPAGTLCIPKICNYPCVDLLLAPRDLFQITVSKSHPVKGPPLSKLISSLLQARWISPLGELRLIFVVPSHVYADFEKQDYLTSEGKVYRTVPADIQRVRQYVLKIDLESAAGGKSPGLQIPVQQNAGTKGSTLEFLQRT
ncbi:hypothetical protein F5H01DRAFT_373650 [Linnemannia elongata]|nr:hypothetical protein F5H01DRAFT_373650 [Linnemannia elongata]